MKFEFAIARAVNEQWTISTPSLLLEGCGEQFSDSFVWTRLELTSIEALIPSSAAGLQLGRTLITFCECRVFEWKRGYFNQALSGTKEATSSSSSPIVWDAQLFYTTYKSCSFAPGAG